MNGDPHARAPDLRAAWRWGLWIGSALLLLGVLAGVAGVFVDHEPIHRSDRLAAPTPSSVHLGHVEDVWLILEGAIVAAIGGGLFVMSLVKLRGTQVKGEEPGPWGSPKA